MQDTIRFPDRLARDTEFVLTFAECHDVIWVCRICGDGLAYDVAARMEALTLSWTRDHGQRNNPVSFAEM